MIRKEGTEDVIEMRAEFGILLPPLSASLHFMAGQGARLQSRGPSQAPT
jgi:hypothetical protein